MYMHKFENEKLNGIVGAIATSWPSGGMTEAYKKPYVCHFFYLNLLWSNFKIKI